MLRDGGIPRVVVVAETVSGHSKEVILPVSFLVKAAELSTFKIIAFNLKWIIRMFVITTIRMYQEDISVYPYYLF